jgi:hypothetical protein
MQDRPTHLELLEAVQHFLREDVMPALEGRLQFHARVAENVLGIVRRELMNEERQLAAEWQRLDDLLGREAIPNDIEDLKARILLRSELLCERIRQGEADVDPFRDAVLAHLRATVDEKLAIANPKLLKKGDADETPAKLPRSN